MRELCKDKLHIRIFETRVLMGEAAAVAVSDKINELLENKEQVNVVFAAAPSQNEFLAALRNKKVDWRRINAFHMDEYVKVAEDASQRFGNFLEERIFGKVSFGNVFYINGNAPDLDGECRRYAALLKDYPTDIVILGIGENTHLAFNDPHVAFFDDPLMVKVVDLDEKNRHQQVDPSDANCFATLEQVPTHAVTLTIPALYKARYAYAIAPGDKKADAIYHTVNSDVQEKYPSTILRTHSHTVLYIDENSAAKL